MLLHAIVGSVNWFKISRKQFNSININNIKKSKIAFALG